MNPDSPKKIPWGKKNQLNFDETMAAEGPDVFESCVIAEMCLAGLRG